MADRKKRDKEIQLNNEYSNINTALAGAISSPPAAIKAVTHVINGAIQSRFLDNFKEAWNLLVEKGAINPDYINNPWAEKQFTEIIKELNKDYIDEQKIEALKNIFLNSSKLNTEDVEAMRVVEIMKIIKKLESLDIYILQIINRLRHEAIDQKSNIQYTRHASSWMDIIMKESELEVIELLLNSEERLMQQSLLTGREHDPSAVQVNANYRLTEFGIRLCEYMSNPLDDKI